jgi:ATPase subunit of ABC transporter with duplicated ATPase domains
MLTRLYIDNFRCFEKFEWKPGRKQLILGRNGCGKTSLMDAVKGLIAFAAYGDRVDRSFRESDRTKWLNQPSQAFGLEADVDGQKCEYELRLAEQGAVQIEAVTAGGASLQFEDGEAIIYPTDSAPGFAYKLDERRSALSTTGDGRFLPFRNWLGGISCWRINPRSMGSWAEGEDREPREDLANFAAWYRHLVQAHPKENTAFLQDLRESLEGLDQLQLEHAGENVRILYAEFCKDGKRVRIPFSDLSDGQRCLICLYAITHFVVAKGGTVIIDEPDNFISLREIQPWLMSMEEMADDHDGQVILISHHPEILNQWAGPYGVQFIRDGAGPVRVEKFKGDPESPLSAAELVARGWDLE